MPPIILPQAFLHAPNTFKPVSHIGTMNNTSSTVLNFKNVVHSMRSCPKTQALSLKGFYHNISVHRPKPKLYLYKFLTIIFPYIVQNPSFISKSFLPSYFRTLSRNPSFISKSFLPLYFRTLSQYASFIYNFFLPLYFRTLSQNPSFISISF